MRCESRRKNSMQTKCEHFVCMEGVTLRSSSRRKRRELHRTPGPRKRTRRTVRYAIGVFSFIHRAYTMNKRTYVAVKNDLISFHRTGGEILRSNGDSSNVGNRYLPIITNRKRRSRMFRFLRFSFAYFLPPLSRRGRGSGFRASVRGPLSRAGRGLSFPWGRTSAPGP